LKRSAFSESWMSGRNDRILILHPFIQSNLCHTLDTGEFISIPMCCTRLTTNYASRHHRHLESQLLQSNILSSMIDIAQKSKSKPQTD
jgi:hypothetical protein